MSRASLKILAKILANNRCGFGRLSPFPTTQVTPYWNLMLSDVFMFHPVLKIGKKTALDYSEILPNGSLNHQHVVDFGLFLNGKRHFSRKKLFNMQILMQNIPHRFCLYIHDSSYLHSFYAVVTQYNIVDFLMFSGIGPSIARLERGATLVLVQPHLISLNPRKMVIIDREDVS